MTGALVALQVFPTPEPGMTPARLLSRPARHQLACNRHLEKRAQLYRFAPSQHADYCAETLHPRPEGLDCSGSKDG